jgi:hypothetical protein
MFTSIGSRLRTGIWAWFVAVLTVATYASVAAANPDAWRSEWLRTDFSKASIDCAVILSGGRPKNSIPAIDKPKFVLLGDVSDLAETETVVGVTVNSVSRAYPLRIFMYHKTVKDILGRIPVAVTYCPLCNLSMVFDRRLDGRVFDFGATGKLRNSDLVICDRQTESWWQQFLGEAIVGEMTGKILIMLPSRLECLARFRARHPPRARCRCPPTPACAPTGATRMPITTALRGHSCSGATRPRASSQWCVSLRCGAWSLPLLRDKGTIAQSDIVIREAAGQNPALDSGVIAEDRDVGIIVVQCRQGDALEVLTQDITFAFCFQAFRPDGVIHK